MDWLRVLLLSSIAVVILLLLQRWAEFNQPHAPKPQAASPAPIYNADVAPPPIATTQIQDAPKPDHIPTPATRSPEKPIPEQVPLIEVQTDVLHLRINLRGGDIEYLALTQYPKRQHHPEQPFVLMEKTSQHRFLAQSGLLSQNSLTPDDKRPLYHSEQSRYVMEDDQSSLRVSMRYQNRENITVEKSFIFSRKSYRIHITHRIVNHSKQAWHVSMFGQLQRGNYPDPHASGNTLSPGSFLGVALNTPEKPYQKLKFSALSKSPIERTVQGGWIALVQHYFVSAWIPPSRESHQYRASTYNGNRYRASWVGPQHIVPAGAQTVLSADFYAGPKIQKNLKLLSPALDLTVDYGWLWWLAQPLALVLSWLFEQFHNWGVAIIILTFFVKLAFYPLSNMGYRSMARMRLVQPKIMALRESYAQDRQQLSQKMMMLYREENINPLGGCLPILVQMPVFLALYWVLLESVELRHAAFFGWITDLSVMDPWFVLPIMMGISMFVQQKMNPPPPDPTQAAIMRWLPAVFTIFFLFFPAGLVLYWVINNLLSMLQQVFVNYQVEHPKQSG